MTIIAVPINFKVAPQNPKFKTKFLFRDFHSHTKTDLESVKKRHHKKNI